MRRFAAMTPTERWAVAQSFYRTARDVKRAGVLAEHPDWNDAQVLEEVRRQFLRA
jgi:Rv0078B-related antitoxin